MEAGVETSRCPHGVEGPPPHHNCRWCQQRMDADLALSLFRQLAEQSRSAFSVGEPEEPPIPGATPLHWFTVKHADLWITPDEAEFIHRLGREFWPE